MFETELKHQIIDQKQNNCNGAHKQKATNTISGPSGPSTSQLLLKIFLNVTCTLFGLPSELLLKGSRVFQNIGFLLNFLAVKLTQTSWIGWSSFSMSSDKEILQLAMKSSGGIVESWNTVNPT